MGTTSPVEYAVDGNVAIITIAQGPVNALGHAVRAAIVDRLEAAVADDAVRAVVITGSGRFFSAGADITEFGTSKSTASPTLSDVVARVEACSKPVLAAINGIAFGGGLELALGAHRRVATESAQIGLPEVTLGIVPGAGGTQRLPRLLPASVAAGLISSGQPQRTADLAQKPGQVLFDQIVPTTAVDFVRVAVDFARATAADSWTPTRDRPPIDDGSLSELAELIRGRARGQEAPMAGLDLVLQALAVPFDDGITAERHTFLRLVAGDQSKALRYAFFAERESRKIPGIDPAVAPRPVAKVGIVGAGTMGGGIAMNFLSRGIPVTILDMTQDGLDRGLATIRRNYQSRVDRGKMTPLALADNMSQLTMTLDYADLGDADLVIEAAFEEMSVKLDVFHRLDQNTKAGAILASNTSTLDINEIAESISRPTDVIGMHFFSPANVMPLLEVVRGAATADDVLVTALAVGRKIGKTPVVAGVCDGFIGNRMLHQYQGAAMTLLRAGASPQQVDQAMERFGFAMGPFRVGDLAGNDISWAVRKRQYAQDPGMPRDEISDSLCELGRFGQKTGAGWYDYQPGSRMPDPSAVVAQLLSDHHTRQGAPQRDFSDEEIVERLVFALADEGARILDEGIALRASDIDVVYLAGYGFPRYRGGPMYYAKAVGMAAH